MQISAKQVAAHLDKAVRRISMYAEQYPDETMYHVGEMDKDPLRLVLSRMAFRDAQRIAGVAVRTGNKYAWDVAMRRLRTAYQYLSNEGE